MNLHLKDESSGSIDQAGDIGQVTEAPTPSRSLMSIWDALSQAGLADMSLRLGTHVLLVALILLFAWGLRSFYQNIGQTSAPEDTAMAASPTTSPQVNMQDAPVDPGTDLSVQVDQGSGDFAVGQAIVPVTAGVSRRARLHTDVPSRSREEVIEYTVKTGDTLFDIATKFGLKPESVLWANQYVLADNPHSLRPGQVLNILPVDGAYHRWSAGDGLNGVARFFSVTPEVIINFPGNHLDAATIGDWANPNIAPGTWLIIPGGQREFVSWSAPVIPLDNPGVAKVLGPGACETVTAGMAGAGVFVWPAENHFISGFDYDPGANHPGIDIDGDEGNPVYAADSGVVVYAGWNNWGYGNVVVINHGNGWQTLYAHLSSYFVSCGQGVSQGNTLGAIGSTGNATGSHLHFEMMYNGVKVNPHDYMK
jgi:murein DD-endopeptidase MepM/ murein hydrolase activator NlpD